MSSIVIRGLESERPASPHDCALLIAAPLDRESFFADLERRDKEFARNFQSQFPALNDDALWRVYQPYAQLAAEVAARAAALGVRVAGGATFADFLRIVCEAPVVTLVAHWRSARFRREDIADAAAVRAYLEQHANLADSAAEPAWDRLNALLDRIAGEDEENPAGSSGYEAARQYRWQGARAQIEPGLGGAVRGGAAVEFADGFHLVGEIVAGIPAGYAGTLDLTVCQSVMLGEEVKRKCRHSLVLTSSGLASMDYRFALYRQVLELLAARPQPFEDAVVNVRKALLKKYGKKQP